MPQYRVRFARTQICEVVVDALDESDANGLDIETLETMYDPEIIDVELGEILSVQEVPDDGGEG